MNQPEKHIQADIVKLLESVGAAVYKLGTTRKRGDHQGTMQTPGLPDLLAFVKVPLFSLDERKAGVLLCIEVKRPGGRMSEAQWQFLWNARNAGCEHVTGGVDEVLYWLRARRVVK